LLCRALGVSHGGFYDWFGRAPSGRSRDNERLTGRIRMSFIESDRTYGSPRVWRDLREWGETCSENRVARIQPRDDVRERNTESYCAIRSRLDEDLIPGSKGAGIGEGHPFNHIRRRRKSCRSNRCCPTSPTTMTTVDRIARPIISEVM